MGEVARDQSQRDGGGRNKGEGYIIISVELSCSRGRWIVPKVLMKWGPEENSLI